MKSTIVTVRELDNGWVHVEAFLYEGVAACSRCGLAPANVHGAPQEAVSGLLTASGPGWVCRDARACARRQKLSGRL